MDRQKFYDDLKQLLSLMESSSRMTNGYVKGHFEEGKVSHEKLHDHCNLYIGVIEGFLQDLKALLNKNA
jgi:hypothetical protein